MIKYDDFKHLIDKIKDTKFYIKQIKDKLDSLHELDIVNCNIITINGKDFSIFNFDDDELHENFSKYIYDSLCTFYENALKSQYDSYIRMIDSLKSIIDENKTIDFSEELKELEL